MQPQSFSICRSVVHSLVVCVNMISAEKVIFQIVSSIILETASCFCWIWCSSAKTGFITRERNGMICVLKFSRARFVYWSKTMLMLFVVIASASNYFLLLCALLFWRETVVTALKLMQNKIFVSFRERASARSSSTCPENVFVCMTTTLRLKASLCSGMSSRYRYFSSFQIIIQ